MPIVICPNCQRRVLVAKGNFDVIHQCNSGDAVFDEEDVVNTSSTVEEFGSTITPVTSANMPKQGAADSFFGTRAGIEGERSPTRFTDRGKNAATHRQRQYYQFIDLKKCKAGDCSGQEKNC